MKTAEAPAANENYNDKLLRLAVYDTLFAFANESNKMTIHRKDFMSITNLIFEKVKPFVLSESQNETDSQEELWKEITEYYTKASIIRKGTIEIFQSIARNFTIKRK